MTFTCAQAFDVNFRTWQKNKESAILKATASETGDVGTSVDCDGPHLGYPKGRHRGQ